MFEKEAEKWVMNNSKNIINKVSNGETNLFGIAEQAYQDGAEFGYNKANEEAKDIINELLINGYDERARAKALDFLYPNKE